MADDRIPQAQSDVLEPNGRRLTLPWFRFFAALDGILASISDGASAALQKASNLTDVASAATAFANIKQPASGTTTGVVQQSQVDTLVLDMAKAANGTRTLVLKAVYAFTVNAIVTDCSSGSCTVTGKIDGTNLGGTANSVTTTESEQAHTTANSVAIGQTLTLVVSANAACLDLVAQVNITRNLAA